MSAVQCFLVVKHFFRLLDRASRVLGCFSREIRIVKQLIHIVFCGFGSVSQ